MSVAPSVGFLTYSLWSSQPVSVGFTCNKNEWECPHVAEFCLPGGIAYQLSGAPAPTGTGVAEKWKATMFGPTLATGSLQYETPSWHPPVMLISTLIGTPFVIFML